MISTSDEVASYTIGDVVFFSVGMIRSIGVAKSAVVPAISPPIKSVSYTSSVSHSETSGKIGPLEQKEEQG